MFPRQQILTPDDVRGKEATLPEALRKHGWPTLKAARGKVIFGMINESPVRDLYLKGHPALAGKADLRRRSPDPSCRCLDEG